MKKIHQFLDIAQIFMPPKPFSLVKFSTGHRSGSIKKLSPKNELGKGSGKTMIFFAIQIQLDNVCQTCGLGEQSKQKMSQILEKVQGGGQC